MLGAIVLVGLAAAVLALRAATTAGATPVRTGILATGPLETRFMATGEVMTPTTTFAPPDWGVVQAIEVREGDLVKSGQLLARIGASAMRSRYLQTRGAWVAARSKAVEALRVLELRKPQIESAIKEARADLQAAEARAATGGAADRAEVDKQRAALQGAIDGRREIAVLEERLHAARADLALRTEDLSNASEQLRSEEMRAPTDGRVTEIMLAAGQRAAPDRPVLSMVSTAPPWVDAWVAEQEASSVQARQPVTLRISALGGRVVPGHVTWVAPSLETPPRAVGGGRFLHIRVAFGADPSAPGAAAERAVPVGLRGGMAVDVDGRRKLADAVTLLPRAAIVGGGDGTWIATVSGGVVHRVSVRLGLTTADFAEQLEGPPLGTRIVLAEAEGLRDGERVRELP